MWDAEGPDPDGKQYLLGRKLACRELSWVCPPWRGLGCSSGLPGHTLLCCLLTRSPSEPRSGSLVPIGVPIRLASGLSRRSRTHFAPNQTHFSGVKSIPSALGLRLGEPSPFSLLVPAGIGLPTFFPSLGRTFQPRPRGHCGSVKNTAPCKPMVSKLTFSVASTS